MDATRTPCFAALWSLFSVGPDQHALPVSCASPRLTPTCAASHPPRGVHSRLRRAASRSASRRCLHTRHGEPNCFCVCMPPTHPCGSPPHRPLALRHARSASRKTQAGRRTARASTLTTGRVSTNAYVFCGHTRAHFVCLSPPLTRSPATCVCFGRAYRRRPSCSQS